MKDKFNLGLRGLLLALSLCFAFSGIAFSQETTGTINGSVTDTTGAAVKGATITITDTAKKVDVRTVVTGDDGQYVAPSLPVSVYTVTVEAPNFKKSIQTNVKLDVNQRRTLDVTLEAGSIAESVSVVADPVTVELTTPTASTVINGDQVRELSVNNRNWISLVTLAPGVSNDLDDVVFTGTNNPDTQVVNRTLISVNGARSTQNTFTVDGADVTDRGSNLTIQAYPSVDSIGEFKVLRSLYPAESGRSGGGQVNVITRSGEDRFHGSAFEFIRNEALNANDFATNRNNSLPVDSDGKRKRKPFRYNNYGFTIGGPVYFFNFGEGNDSMFKKLDKTFFFFSEEQRRDTRYPTISTLNNGTAAPTTAMKQGIFPIDICLRTSGTTCTAADVLPAGTPLSSRVPLSNVAQQYVNKIWNNVPTSNPADLQLSFPTLNIAKFHQEIIKIDHNFSDKWSAFYRYERDTIPTIDADGSIGTRSNLPFVNQMKSDSPGRTHTFQTTYIISPNLILEGRYSYGYGAIFTETTGLLAKQVSPIAVALPYTSVRDVVPVLSFSSGFASLTGFSNYNNFSWKQNYNGSLTWTSGNHTMKFGGVYSLYRKNENALSGTNQGSFTIPAVTALAPGITSNAKNKLYQQWANFLQGNNVNFTQSKLDLTVDLRQKAVESFAQDEWKVRSNLTLYYGVRYSYFGPPYDKNGQLSNFVPGLFNPAQAPQVTGAGNRVVSTGNFCNGLIVNAQNYSTGPANYNCTPIASPYGKYIYHANNADFAPRVGLAWDPFKKGKTSIRMGYGMYHEQVSESAAELLATNPPYQETATVNGTTLDSPIPQGQSVTAVASLATANVRGIQADFKTPYMQHWSLDFQQQLGAKTVVTVGYFGSKGTHLNGFTELDDLPPGLALNSNCAPGNNTIQTSGVTLVKCQPSGYAFRGLIGVTGNPNPTFRDDLILDQIRPYRGYRSINMLETRYNSNYHSLQASAQHRFSGASQLNLAYTWSKNLTDNPTSSISAAPQDSYNIRADYGRAILDRTHVFSANYIYELPFFSDQKGLAGKLLGGWQASGIVTLTSGLPFTITTSGFDAAGLGLLPAAIAGPRPRVLCDPSQGATQTLNQWFNTACFEQNPAATSTGIPNVVGNAPRGFIEGPPTKRVDFTLTKNIRLGESTKLQLRAEAFNVFNHTNFRALSTNVTSTTFGQVTSFRDPRVIQLGAKFYF
jgi:hypothetical protein